MIVWLTGLPCSGKTTLDLALIRRLGEQGQKAEFLDGDVVRGELWRDLGFKKTDRHENIRRLGYVAELIARHGVVVVVSAVSPYRAARDLVRGNSTGFLEVY